MKLFALLTLLVAASTAHKGEFSSFHDSFDPDRDIYEKIDRETFSTDKFPYQPPGPGDVRSACPFLSTCANHGILPRDGKNIHFETLYRCAHFGGFGKTLFRTSRSSFAKIVSMYRVGDIKRGLPASQVRPFDRISLDETSFHGPIEHDLSFTRLDVGSKPDFNLHQTGRRDLGLVKGLFSYATRRDGCRLKPTDFTDSWLLNPKSLPVDDACYLDIEDMGAWFQDRKAMEEKRHRELNLGRPVQFGLRELIAASGEATFFIRLMGRHGKISLEHARVFMVHERFPDGWKPRPDTFHFPHAVPHIVEMALSYLKPRSKPNPDFDSWKKRVGSMGASEVFEILTKDYDGDSCTGDSNVCPRFSPLMDD